MIRLENGDFLDVAKTIADNSIDCVITDCPYHIVVSGCCTNPNKPTGVLSASPAVRQGKMFEHNDIKFSQWLPDVYRVLKENSHCYIMINSRNLMRLQEEAEKVGFKFQNLLVWKKNNVTPSKYYMQQCEFILFLKKRTFEIYKQFRYD